MESTPLRSSWLSPLGEPTVERTGGIFEHANAMEYLLAPQRAVGPEPCLVSGTQRRLPILILLLFAASAKLGALWAISQTARAMKYAQGPNAAKLIHTRTIF